MGFFNKLQRRNVNRVLRVLVVFVLVGCDTPDRGPNDVQAPAPPSADAAIAVALDAVLEKYAENESLPGLVAGLATTDGIVYVGADGYLDLESKRPMVSDSIIAIASMTKPVTAVAVLQLVEANLLDLDVPITRYLPQHETLKVLQGFDDNGEAVFVAPATKPTTRQLLSHTSGFVYEIWNENAQRGVESGQLPSLVNSGLEGLNAPLGFSPGERWEYGMGIEWAGVLVETVSGKRLDAYFEEHIFEPLQMTDTFFAVPPEKQARAASIYQRTAEGFQRFPSMPIVVNGGGGLYSTVTDYLRFMRALLNGGTLDGARILAPETVETMFENQIGELNAGRGQSQVPMMSNDFDASFGVPARFGLGVLLHEEKTAAGRSAGTGSWAGMFNSYFWIDRENGVAAVAGTQVLPFFDGQAVQMIEEYEATIYERLNLITDENPAASR